MSDRTESVMLWTGGKDSCLALHEAGSRGFEVTSLVTLVPPGERFRAHPVAVLRMQAEAMRLPYRTVEVGMPFRLGYAEALRRIRDEMSVGTIITGDIDAIAGHPNWIRVLSDTLGMEVVIPLWKRDRLALLESMVERKFRVCISCVNRERMGEEWVGSLLDDAGIQKLIRWSSETGGDLCGEQGEYHTLVLDAPMFDRSLQFDQTSVTREGAYSFLNIFNSSVKKRIQYPHIKHSPSSSRISPKVAL